MGQTCFIWLHPFILTNKGRLIVPCISCDLNLRGGKTRDSLFHTLPFKPVWSATRQFSAWCNETDRKMTLRQSVHKHTAKISREHCFNPPVASQPQNWWLPVFPNRAPILIFLHFCGQKDSDFLSTSKNVMFILDNRPPVDHRIVIFCCISCGCESVYANANKLKAWHQWQGGD